MPAPEAKTFAIAQITIYDRDVYSKYENAPHLATFDKFDGKLVALDEGVEVIEGNWPYTRTVVIEFPTKELAHAWYDSDEYQAVVGFRHKSATSNVVIVSGFPPWALDAIQAG